MHAICFEIIMLGTIYETTEQVFLVGDLFFTDMQKAGFWVAQIFSFEKWMIQRKKVEFDRYPVVPNEMHLHFQPFRETEAGREIQF